MSPPRASAAPQDGAPRLAEEGSRPQAAPAEAARRLLRTLGHAVKLHALYKAGHPVAAEAVAEALRAFERLLAEAGGAEVSVGAADGRWLLDGLPLGERTEAFEVLGSTFRSLGLRSLTLRAGLRPFELAAFCELASAGAGRDPEEFLRQRGARRIRLNVEEFVRASRAPRAPVADVQSPVLQAPPPKPAPGPAGDGRPGGGWGFGTFIKNLVEGSVHDPAERARIYADAVRNVKEALTRHVQQATARLERDRTRAVNQGLRIEHVLAALADGRVTVDREGRVLMMDPKAEEIVGGPLSAVAGRPLVEAVSSDDRVVTLSGHLQLPEEGTLTADVRTAGPGEVLEALRQSLAVVQDEEGRTVGTYAVLPHAAKYREAARVQEEFLSSVTHELKAPLASICSALELVRDKARAKLSPEEAEFIEISVRNSQLLRGLIEDILDFSRLRAGKMSVRPEPCAVEPILREAADGLGPWARSKGVGLLIDPRCRPAALPAVLADRTRAVQILNNLVSNSIKHTEEAGRVRVAAAPGKAEHAGAVVFSVKDDGCGIAEEDRARLFEKFSQLAQGIRRGGAGLGLAIVRELVGLQGGRVWLNSKVGKGTTFYFTLPVAPQE